MLTLLACSGGDGATGPSSRGSSTSSPTGSSTGSSTSGSTGTSTGGSTGTSTGGGTSTSTGTSTGGGPSTGGSTTAAAVGTYTLMSGHLLTASAPCATLSSAGCRLPSTAARPLVLRTGSLILKADGTVTITLAGDVGGTPQGILSTSGTFTASATAITLKFPEVTGSTISGWGVPNVQIMYTLPVAALGGTTDSISLLFQRLP
jgi:hypothetical protein